jgi:hypothetical protein
MKFTSDHHPEPSHRNLPLRWAFPLRLHRLGPGGQEQAETSKPSSCHRIQATTDSTSISYNGRKDGSGTSSYIIYRVTSRRRRPHHHHHHHHATFGSVVILYLPKKLPIYPRTTGQVIFGCPLTLALRDGLSHTRSSDLNLHENSKSPSKIQTKSP